MDGLPITKLCFSKSRGCDKRFSTLIKIFNPNAGPFLRSGVFGEGQSLRYEGKISKVEGETVKERGYEFHILDQEVYHPVSRLTLFLTKEVHDTSALTRVRSFTTALTGGILALARAFGTACRERRP